MMSNTPTPLDDLVAWRGRGRALAAKAAWTMASASDEPKIDENPLRDFFNARTEGRGIWKWTHYFDIYHRHLAKFRGLPINLLEIGVYGGGSLELWRDYLGPQANLYGLDIQPACANLKAGGAKIFIADQADRSFWRDFRAEVPVLDVVIDDGGHQPEQQMVTTEELLPYLQPGGVFCCEDVHGAANAYMAAVQGMANGLDDTRGWATHPEDDRRSIVVAANPLQSTIRSVCRYPYVVVIEKNDRWVPELVAEKRGNMWDPSV
jgi:hypothetical protein